MDSEVLYSNDFIRIGLILMEGINSGRADMHIFQGMDAHFSVRLRATWICYFGQKKILQTLTLFL
jgi:hypothetical protein